MDSLSEPEAQPTNVTASKTEMSRFEAVTALAGLIAHAAKAECLSEHVIQQGLRAVATVMRSNARLDLLEDKVLKNKVLAQDNARLGKQLNFFNDRWGTRFFEIVTNDAGTKQLNPTTEAAISHFVDTLDLTGEPLGEFVYFTAEGDLVPLSISPNKSFSQCDDRGELPFNYAQSSMVANDNIVGTVHFTDH